MYWSFKVSRCSATATHVSLLVTDGTTKYCHFECKRSSCAFAKDALRWSSQVRTALLDMRWHSCGIQNNTFTFRLCSLNVHPLTFVISAGLHVFPSAPIPHPHSTFQPFPQSSSSLNAFHGVARKRGQRSANREHDLS